MTELAQKTTDHIGHLSALPTGGVAGAMDREKGLPVLGFGFDKRHCCPPDSFANSHCINRICLAAFVQGPVPQASALIIG